MRCGGEPGKWPSLKNKSNPLRNQSADLVAEDGRCGSTKLWKQHGNRRFEIPTLIKQKLKAAAVSVALDRAFALAGGNSSGASQPVGFQVAVLATCSVSAVNHFRMQRLVDLLAPRRLLRALGRCPVSWSTRQEQPAPSGATSIPKGIES